MYIETYLGKLKKVGRKKIKDFKKGEIIKNYYFSNGRIDENSILFCLLEKIENIGENTYITYYVHNELCTIKIEQNFFERDIYEVIND